MTLTDRPIKSAFSKIKAILKKAAALSFHALRDALDAVAPQVARSFFIAYG
ncbi:MAG: hypothetical protein OXC93_01250 [Rhodospirillaceae bacterium]|nr:hypothetical protein [Rhodospirillaceae bacterium]